MWAKVSTGKHPHEPPRPALIVSVRRTRAGEWEAWCVMVDDLTDPADPRVFAQWVPYRLLRPVKSDPNLLFGLR